MSTNIPLPKTTLIAAFSAILIIGAQAQMTDDLPWGPRGRLTLAAVDDNAGGGAGATDEAAKKAELLKKSLNPVASLISVPFQNNWDFGIGPSDAMKYTMNFQPVIPVSLNDKWNVISRTILPTIYLESTAPGVGSKTLADGAGIYTLGFQPGSVLRGNLIHDVHRSAYAQGGAPNNGFFIDEGSKGFLFESNVVHKISGESVRFNQCQREWHTWKGNAFDGNATQARIAAAAQRAGLEPAYQGVATGRP